MSDATWARYARLAFWMVVALAVSGAVLVGARLTDWHYGETIADRLANFWSALLIGRYALWHEQIEAARK